MNTKILCPISNYSCRLQSREYCIFYRSHLPVRVTAEGPRNISCTRGADRTICYGGLAPVWLWAGDPWEGNGAESHNAAEWEEPQWEELPVLVVHGECLRGTILHAPSCDWDGSNPSTRIVRENSLSLVSLRGSCSSHL